MFVRLCYSTIELFGVPDLHRLCVVHVHRKLINCIAWHPQYTGDATEPSNAQYWLASGSNESVVHVVDVTTVLSEFILCPFLRGNTVLKKPTANDFIIFLTWKPFLINTL